MKLNKFYCILGSDCRICQNEHNKHDGVFKVARSHIDLARSKRLAA